MSTTSSGLTLNMTNTIQADRYPEFSCVPGHQGSDSPQSSALAPAYSKSGKWESSSGIWGINGINGIKNIGSSLSNTGRDVSIPRSAGNNDFADRPSGSSALTASSEADPWLSSPWNNANVASPATLSSNASISPPHTQNSNSTTNQNALLKVQNAYQQQQPTRHAFRHSASFSRSQSKSNIDPSSNIKFTRKSSAPYDGKENLSGQSPLQQDKYETDFSRRLPIGSSATRDGSVSQSETTEWGFNNVNTNPLHGNGDTQFGSGGNNATNGFSQSQPTNFSNLPFSRATHTNAQHPDFSASEVEVSEKLGTLRLGHNPEQPSSLSKNIGANFSSQNPHFPLQGFPLLDDSMMWAEGPKAMNSYQSYWGQPWSNQTYVNKPQRFPEKGPLPFSAVDNRRGLNSPKYRSRPTSAAPIPPSQSGSSRSRISQGSGHLERKASTLAHSPAHPHMLGSQLQNQPSLQLYELLPNTLRSGFPYNNPMLMQSYTSLQVVPSRLGKDHDLGVRIRSQLLEEFRANTKFNKRYELKDIYHHIVEFSGDQHGSRFIQTKLETANSDEKEQVFREIQPNALQLMTDVFGNYVIQKLFEHGNQVQKRVLAEQMKNHVMELSLQMYGCRVVQKALEHVLADQQAQLVDELQVDVLRCVKDQNGNHVVQKAIERVPSQHVQFIIDAFRGQIENLATHPYGCRVIQRILEFCKPHDQASILRELHECSQLLITDQYGNYVTQHVIQHGKPEDREKIINLVIGQLLTLSKHKFASNVVEKSIIHGTEQQRRVMASLLTASNTDGTNSLQLMMKDQFGNYVIQKLIAQLQGVEKAAFLNDMKPQLLLLKKYNYGKQIAVIEKLVFSAPQSSQSTTGPSQPKDMPVTRINSNTPSPTLNDAQISPRNNCFSSTNELSNST